MNRKKNSTKITEDNIIQVLTSLKGKQINHKQIFTKIPEPKPEKPEQLLPILNSLVEEKKIKSKEKYKYYCNQLSQLVKGSIDISKKGAIYLIVENHEMDYIVLKNNKNLLQGDYVEAGLVSREKTTKAEIFRVISHYPKTLVGTLYLRNNQWQVQSTNNKFSTPFYTSNKTTLKQGFKVSFKIKGYNDSKKQYEAEIIEILGESGNHHTEMHAILTEFGLPEKFEPAIEKEALEIKSEISTKEIKNRKDYRQVLTVTIDPETAKDFDDAISYQILTNGNTEVGVHIADVSHYLLANTPLDMEAQKRATSIYLVDRVVPMLPFNLSDNLCSLVPNEDRLTFAAIFEFDKKYNIVNKSFSKTIIHSDKRFSYEEAQEIIEKKEGLHSKEINHLNEIALHLQNLKFKHGAINFESPETRFVLNEQFEPIDVYVKERKEAHKMIEEFMLLANRSVAEYMFTQKPQPPFIYRTHDEPSETRISDLKLFLSKFGYNLILDNEKTLRNSINEISEKIIGKPEQDIVRQMCIRSMAKAVYTPNKPSHFGLAFPYYTHFTSPIRRYPDVIAHRLLFAHLNGDTMEKAYQWNMTKLDALCKHSSQMEQLATDAERASIKYKQAEYLENKIGEIFEGAISGLTDWGMFVELKNNKCEGMIRLNTISDDYYEYDNKMMAVVGKKFFKKYKLGDVISVKISAVNKTNRTIDLKLVSNESRKPHRK